MHKPNAVAIGIMDVHFAIAPTLISRLEIKIAGSSLQVRRLNRQSRKPIRRASLTYSNGSLPKLNPCGQEADFVRRAVGVPRYFRAILDKMVGLFPAQNFNAEFALGHEIQTL